MILTIVTITKNDPDGLARTLKSTAIFSSAMVEHLIVTDGGDNRGVLETVHLSDSQVRVLSQQTEGIADAFNTGLANARGEWVWFLNGGDAVHESLDPQWLSSLLTRTHADVVTGVLHFDGEEQPRSAPPLRLQWPLVACWIAHPATLARTGVLRKYGGFDQRWRIAMDFDLWHRLLRENLVVDVISVPFARFDKGGISERLDSQKMASREKAAVLRRYALSLLKAWWGVSHRCVGAALRGMRLWR